MFILNSGPRTLEVRKITVVVKPWIACNIISYFIRREYIREMRKFEAMSGQTKTLSQIDFND